MISNIFKSVLNRYVTLLSDKNIRCASSISASEIELLEMDLKPFKLSCELRALYLKCNGAEVDYNFATLGISDFKSFQQCFEYYSFLKDIFSGMNLSWPEALFPIGGDNEGQYLLSLLNKDICQKSKIFFIDIASGSLDVTLEFDSLESLLKVLIETEKRKDSRVRNFGDTFEQLHSNIFPGRYISTQKGVKGLDGNQNIFDLQDTQTVPDSWH